MNSPLKKRIILAGGSGFLGQALARHFSALRWEVVVLTRQPKPRADGLREVAWDGETVGAWARELEGAEAVVNLCGKSVDCRYTKENRKLLINSRTMPTRAIGQAIANCQSPPRVWLNSSSASLYKHTFDTAMDENGAQGATREAKDEFSIEIIRQWEQAFNETQTPLTRKAALRTTMVLGMSRNSVVPVLRRLTRLGLGGRMGSGQQFVSWMHQEDFCRAVEWVITHDELSGPMNITAPNPLPNAEMMRLFRTVCGVPFGLPATEWMLELGAFFLRTETELIIKSRRVVPGRLLASGFTFRFPSFREALENILSTSRSDGASSAKLKQKRSGMPSGTSRVCILVALMSFVTAGSAVRALPGPSIPAKTNTLEAGFCQPADDYKPHTWWHWMNGHVTKEAITRDLEDMKRIGLGGFTLWNTQEGTPAGPVKYASEEWWALLGHTVNEAERLGLEMGIFNGAGWSSTGAAFVTPDKAMQEVAWTEAEAKGPGLVKIKLAIPKAALGIERDMKKDPVINQRYYMPREHVEGWFRDIAVFAVPALPKGQKLWQLKEWQNKAAFGKMAHRFSPDNRTPPAGQVIPLEQVIDLSKYMNADGELAWEAPAGEWTILRMGYQPTGRNNHPAAEGGRGLEIDKMSAEAMDFYWEHFLSRVVKTAGSRIGKTFLGVSLDSYEVGHQNWNKDFARSFKEAMGYDMRAFLPVVTGRIVESVDVTERVLWDYRKVIGDLIAKNYYGRMAERAHAVGLQFANEPYGSYGNTSDFVVAGKQDIPTCEWWAYDTKQLGRSAEAKMVASAAHTYGRKMVDSEAFTGTPERIFETYPGGIKGQGDYFMTLGVNRFSFHTWAHDPYNIPPGLGLGTYGSRFDNRNTWWPFAKPWHAYLSRCFYLLRQGEFVGDVLYYSGDEAPLRGEALRRELILPDLPQGTDYALANPEILLLLRFENGRLCTEKGSSFRLLVLPDSPWMPLNILEKIEVLLKQGALVSGPKPVSLPGKIKAGEMQKFQTLVQSIWGACDGVKVKSNTVGKGVLYSGMPLEEVLKRHSISEDFSFTHTTEETFGPARYAKSGIAFIHRRTPSEDIYFLSNQHEREKSIVATFNVVGKVPEVWMADSGHSYRLPEAKTMSGKTEVPLHFGPSETCFIVFRDPSNATAIELPLWSRVEKSVADLSEGWSVNFHESGGDVTETMPKLVSWTELKNEKAKYHSGSATYCKKFDWNPDIHLAPGNGNGLFLDLGDVQVIARVVVNSKDCGIAWKNPYRVEVTEALKPGVNTIEITVANLWVNRIIGDQQYADDIEWTSKTGSTAAGQGLSSIPDWVKNKTTRPNPERKAFYGWKWPHLTSGKKLLPSGLLGPVRLVSEERCDFISEKPAPGYLPLATTVSVADVFVANEDWKVAQIATRDLVADIERVTGRKPALKQTTDSLSEHAVLVGTLGKSPVIDQLIKEGRLDVKDVQGQWESFVIATVADPLPGVRRALVIAGSDRRGTAYGVYELSKRIGVSPWYWWADVTPLHRESLHVSQERLRVGPPAVKYRGIFINDEMWGLRPWAMKNFAPEEGHGLGPRTHAKIFELLLRLRANHLWPAMHNGDGGTIPFNCYEKNKEVADDYAVTMGSSHIEPMLRNNISGAEWDREYPGEPWDYTVNKEHIYKYWEDRVKANGKYENVYTMGKRGKDDEPGHDVTVPILEQIIADQRTILKKWVDQEITRVPQVLIAYTEVLNLYNKGLSLPEDIILCWPDDNFGYIRQLPDASEQKRSGGSGIYYHIQWLNGATSAYTWLNTTPPALIWEEMNKAFQYGANKLWVLNVGDIKPGEIGTEFFLEMACDPTRYRHDNVRDFLVRWAARDIDPRFAEEIASIMEAYYRLGLARRPEHLVQAKGKNPLTYSWFSHTQANDEALQRVEQYDALARRAQAVYDQVPMPRKDAFFQFVLYPVQCAGLLNAKVIYADKSARYGAEGRASASEYAEKARAAAKRIIELTDHYNAGLLTVSNKWNHMISAAPGPWGTQFRQFEMPPLSDFAGKGPPSLGVALEGGDAQTLADLSVYTQGKRLIDLYNTGKGEIRWTAIPSQPWVQLNVTSGTFTTEQQLWVSIEWPRVPKGESLTATIDVTSNAGNKSFVVPVFNPISPAREEVTGYVESHGYVSMEAEHFMRKQSRTGAAWEIINGLGRSGDSVTVLPATVSSITVPTEIMTNSPSMEYDLYLFSSGEARLDIDCLPTKAVTPKQGVRLAFSLDGQEPKILSGPGGDVLANLRRLTTTVIVASPGKHKLTLWMVDPGVVIDKLVLSFKPLKETYLGPPESYHR